MSPLTDEDELNANREAEPERRWCIECAAFRYDEEPSSVCHVCATPFAPLGVALTLAVDLDARAADEPDASSLMPDTGRCPACDGDGYCPVCTDPAEPCGEECRDPYGDHEDCQDDEPMLCGLCGVREPAPGLTACRGCA